MHVTIRRFRERDKQKVLQFLKSVFAGWRTTRQWSWKFEKVEDALGRRAAIWVVEDAGEIVGHLAFIPMKLRVGNEVFPVCQLVDGALSPKYRHGGVYAALVRTVLQDAEKEGNSATFGFANRPSHRVYSNIGSLQTICTVAKMFKVLSLGNLMRTMHVHLTTGGPEPSGNDSLIRDLFPTLRKQAVPTLLGLFRNVMASIVSGPSWVGYIERSAFAIRTANIGDLAGFEGMWYRLSRNYRYTFERDGNYLKWRYSDPEAEYKVYTADRSGDLVGYVSIACEEKVVSFGKIRFDGMKIGYVMDLIAEEEAMIPLLLMAEKALKEQGACLVSCWTTENSPLHGLFRKMRYYRLPKEIRKISFIADFHASRLEATISSKQTSDVLIALGDADLV